MTAGSRLELHIRPTDWLEVQQMLDYTGHQNAQDCASTATSFRAWLGQAFGALKSWDERTRHRSELIELPPHLLFDIGLTWADVEEEARKLPWQRPSLAARTTSDERSQ
jgi:uncharacterized protein YjiS (DUF1127 family)